MMAAPGGRRTTVAVWHQPAPHAGPRSSDERHRLVPGLPGCRLVAAPRSGARRGATGRVTEMAEQRLPGHPRRRVTTSESRNATKSLLQRGQGRCLRAGAAGPLAAGVPQHLDVAVHVVEVASAVRARPSRRRPPPTAHFRAPCHPRGAAGQKCCRATGINDGLRRGARDRWQGPRGGATVASSKVRRASCALTASLHLEPATVEHGLPRRGRAAAVRVG